MALRQMPARSGRFRSPHQRAGRPNHPPKRRSRRGRIAYFLFLSVFTIALVEIGARWYLSNVLQKSSENKFRFNSYRVYEHVPGFREGDGERDWIEINGQGFRRSQEVSIAKPAGTKRVFFLGGSAAHGITSAAPYPVVHIYQDETVDAHLERMLKEALPGQKVEVINAAVTGYQVFQHTQYLLTELLAYRPDLVIFFDGNNDHFVNDTNYRYMTDFRYQFWKPYLQEPSFSGTWMSFASWMSKYSGAFRGYLAWKMTRDAIKEGMRVDWQGAYVDDATTISNHKKVARDQYLRAIDDNLFLLARDSIKAIVCLQPARDARYRALSANERAFLHTDRNVAALYPVVVEELKEVTGRWGVPFADLNPAMNDPRWDGEQLLIDYCHLSAKGGEACASALLPLVIDALIGTSTTDTLSRPAASGI
ncbi:MAG: SGNH/GDSL hydrolase family protein [Flavobacteriales bacterium]|nr:SGNH/GDSL hydrolase family protein [Flavobacteriales bacterium]